MEPSIPIPHAVLYIVGAGLVDNSMLKQEAYAKPAPTLEPSAKRQVRRAALRAARLTMLI
jgi:hypothetical protein